jgi:hypothetical protein
MPRQKRDEIEIFTDWIVANGGEKLAPTNRYELLRFKCHLGIGIVYQSEKGKRTWSGAAKELRESFAKNKPVRLTPIAFKRRHDDKRFPALIVRDGDRCFYGCGTVMTSETATIEHLCSRTHGGPDHIANVVLSCDACNKLAGHLSISEKISIREKRLFQCLREAV